MKCCCVKSNKITLTKVASLWNIYYHISIQGPILSHNGVDLTAQVHASTMLS